MVSTRKRAPTLGELKARRKEITAIVERYGAYNVRVVGSVARGEAGPDSDIDLLMTIPPKRSVFDLVGLWMDLQELLGRPVSIIPDSIDNEAFEQSVLKDAVSL